MLLINLIMFLTHHNREVLALVPIVKETHKSLIECAVDISNKYFIGVNQLTYVGTELDDDEILQEIHSTSVVPMVSRVATRKLDIQHDAYLITATNVSTVLCHFVQLTKERTWNPSARFLVILNSVSSHDLNVFYDQMLHLHIDNVVLVNSAGDTQLYSYDAFSNYACGKRYESVISYGSCARAHQRNLYPNKYTTGLQKCTLTGLITHWPPYAIAQSNISRKFPQTPLGLEPYLLGIIGDMQGFQLDIVTNPIQDEFSTVDADMVAHGTLRQLQTHEADLRVGGMMLIPSRSHAFAYAYGHSTYERQINFLIKKAAEVEHWKYIYLEFDIKVWLSLIVAFVLYSLLMVKLLRANDKWSVVLKLLKCLLSAGCRVKCSPAVQCVFTVWVWGAYFINAMYQSVYFSFLANHPMEYQVSSEADLTRYRYTSCFGSSMDYFVEESSQGKQISNNDCYNRSMYDSIEAILNSDKKLYTIVQYEPFQYPKKRYYDKYGNPRAYIFREPYAKTIQVIYLYKGFPFVANMSKGLLWLKENGIANKIHNDMVNIRNSRFRFSTKDFETNFAIPWRLYMFGCILSTIIFILELIIYNKCKIIERFTFFTRR